jgi:hypothetical protein
LLKPGKSTAPGQHWFYHRNGHRKCWYQAEEGSASARKPVQRQAARQRAAAPEENESEPRKAEAVEDARAGILSAAPAASLQSTPSEPAPKIVQTVPVPMTGDTALASPAPVVAMPGADQLTPDQLTPDQSTPRPLDVEVPVANAPAASSAVASVPPATPVGVPAAETGDGEGWSPSWPGLLLMVLGFALLLSARPLVRRALRPRALSRPKTEVPVIAPDTQNDVAFVRPLHAQTIGPDLSRRDHVDRILSTLAQTARPASDRRKSEANQSRAKPGRKLQGLKAG